MNRWDLTGLVSAAALVTGFWALVWGLEYHEPVPVFWGGAAMGLGVSGWAVLFRAWVAWHRVHGSWLCWIWRGPGRRVHHFHWPKAKIVDCTNAAGFAGRLER